MLGSVLIPLVLMAVQQPQPTLVQKSSGWCSPNISNVVGKVAVNCIGVDPRALKRLNAELDRKNLQLAEKIREADEWTTKYKELEAQLTRQGEAQLSREGVENVISQQAEEYLHEGELEKAGALLDQILDKEEKDVDLTAANHYNRALAFELQMRPLEALPHLAKAYHYRPEEWKYAIEYVEQLLNQNDFKTPTRPALIFATSSTSVDKNLAKPPTAIEIPTTVPIRPRTGVAQTKIRSRL